MRTVYRLRLFLFCFCDRESPILRLLLYLVVHLLTCNPVETMAGPSKVYYTLIYSPGVSLSIGLHGSLGQGKRYEPDPSSQSFDIINFWWTWRESNPRPEFFSFCFIQPYFSILPMLGAPSYPWKVCAAGYSTYIY